jgi:hypothetical protein
MIIHGFAFDKFAKPVDEHHLQVAPYAQTWFTSIYRDCPHEIVCNHRQKIKDKISQILKLQR